VTDATDERPEWDPPDQLGEHTRAIHLPPAPRVEQVPLGQAVWRTSTFGFDTSQEYADVLGRRAPGYSYTRIDNPTVDAFADAVAALEHPGGVDIKAQAFGSGMAAITATLLAFTGAGTHVVAPAGCYGGTWSLLRHTLSRFGVDTTFVDGTDVDAYAEALQRPTAVVWAETLTNPTMAVADLPRLAALAHDAGALLAVDSTFASPVVCQPLRHGVDLVIHSATKYLGGHSDATGGVVVGRADLLEPIRLMRVETGGVLAPDEAFLLRRGLETLPLRMIRHCSSALALAEAVADHPAVERVDYPGLPGHPGHDLAQRLFLRTDGVTRYGAVIWVVPHGGWEAGLRFAELLRLPMTGASLGGTHTLAGHAASTTHRQLDQAALAAGGIDPAGVRVSVGLEDVADLTADMLSALDQLSGSPSAQPDAEPPRR
jgi:cystathionine beta-lyase/cystathionine gamma-synthase